MIRKIAACTALLSTLAFVSLPADAQGVAQSQGATGNFGRASRRTNNFRLPDTPFTRSQRAAFLPTGLGGTASIHGPTGRNGLPTCSMDSFVLNAGGSAEAIYGDEGSGGLPPYFEFSKAHRINRGITGQRNSGLTTGHGSYLPDAWGGDEFVDGPEFSQSGSNGGGQYWTTNSGNVGTNPGTSNPGGNPSTQPSNLPYTPGEDWAAIYSQDGQLMGHMAPGETWGQFFSGDSGHLLPGFEGEGARILENEIGNPNGTFGGGG